MKTLLHNQLAAAGQMASTLRQLPGAPLRLPSALADHQSFVDRVYRRSQPKPTVQPLCSRCAAAALEERQLLTGTPMNVPQVTPGRILFLYRGLSFQKCKASALTALKRGDRAGARFWGAQARVDWALLANPPTTRLS